jgi:CRP/FNR family transcriptional regulator, anaerobic regulatory protein
LKRASRSWSLAAHELIYRLRTGWAARSRSLPDRRKQIILVFLPGDLFGTKCIFLVRQPDAIEALDTVSVEWIDHLELSELVRANPDAALRLNWQAIEDERRLGATDAMSLHALAERVSP